MQAEGERSDAFPCRSLSILLLLFSFERRHHLYESSRDRTDKREHVELPKCHPPQGGPEAKVVYGCVLTRLIPGFYCKVSGQTFTKETVIFTDPRVSHCVRSKTRVTVVSMLYRVICVRSSFPG